LREALPLDDGGQYTNIVEVGGVKLRGPLIIITVNNTKWAIPLSNVVGIELPSGWQEARQVLDKAISEAAREDNEINIDPVEYSQKKGYDPLKKV